MAFSWFEIIFEPPMLGFLVYLITRQIQFYFFPSSYPLKRYRRNPQSWAVITGASAGIGYGFAQELVTRGFGVVLIARTQVKLEAAAQRLREGNPEAAVKTIVWDATDVDCDRLTAALQPVMDLPVTMLINNVGGVPMDPPFKSLVDCNDKDVVRCINMNVIFTAQLTRIMIPVLERNGPSVVVTMGSAAEGGGSWMVLYGGCKGFASSFAVGLAREFQALGSKVDSVGIIPGEVYSDFVTKATSPLTPTSRQYAKCVLDRVERAVDWKWWVTKPYWGHAIPLALFDVLPEVLKQKLLVNMIKTYAEDHSKQQ